MYQLERRGVVLYRIDSLVILVFVLIYIKNNNNEFQKEEGEGRGEGRIKKLSPRRYV